MKISRKKSRFVDLEFVKTCNELVTDLRYVGGMLRQSDKKCKVYCKDKKFKNDDTIGFVIFTIKIKERNEGN
jgi:hypothetical protein